MSGRNKHTQYKDKAIYNILSKDGGDKNDNRNQSYQLEVIMIIIILMSSYHLEVRK
jgi:hypothetical protein